MQTTVVDNGTGIVKAGFAGDSAPRLVFPCAIGRPSKRQAAWDQPLQGTVPEQGPCVGFDALEPANGQVLDTSYPMSNGVVCSWDDMMLVWDHTWNKMGASPCQSNIMLTDPVFNPTANRQRMIEVMLETYGFQGVGMQAQAVLTLYAHGLETGVVLDSGDGVSHAVAVVDGYTFAHLSQRLDLAGRHITQHLMEMLIRKGAALHRVHDMHWVRRIKEASCYVAPDYERELKLARETTCLTKSYTLPDGRVIKVGPERFQAPEALFRPALMDLERPGIATMLFNAINECDINNRRQLYENVVISGGTTMLPGLPTRLEAELRTLYLDKVLQGDVTRLSQMKMKVRDSAERQHLVFRGAAILAKLMEAVPDYWVTKAEWQEDPHRALKRLLQSTMA